MAPPKKRPDSTETQGPTRNTVESPQGAPLDAWLVALSMLPEWNEDAMDRARQALAAAVPGAQIQPDLIEQQLRIMRATADALQSGGEGWVPEQANVSSLESARSMFDLAAETLRTVGLANATADTDTIEQALRNFYASLSAITTSKT